MSRLALFLATCGYLSYLPAKLMEGTELASKRRWTGAGLIGTLGGLALLFALPTEPVEYAAAVTVLTVLACAAAELAEPLLGVHDDPRIVVDETVGFLAAAAFLPRQAGWLAAAFVLFRILDAAKLPPYRDLERLPGGLGVVADDVGAGILASLLLHAARWATQSL